MPSKHTFEGVLLLPRLRVQNANMVSGPMTWGFPSITAFMGLMWALERKLAAKNTIFFETVGVICHKFEPQASFDPFKGSLHLTRNPLKL